MGWSLYFWKRTLYFAAGFSFRRKGPRKYWGSPLKMRVLADLFSSLLW